MNTLLYKQLDWLTRQLSTIDYSTDKQRAILYELGLLRSIVAQLMYNDSHNTSTVKHIIKNNPYNKTTVTQR